MKLVIVSHTPHYRSEAGTVGWGPTVREIDHLAELFREIVHIAPLHEVTAPESALPYSSTRVRVVAVRPAGGDGARSKPGILLRAPGWARAILREGVDADVLHVRCPAGISLVALALLPFLGHPARRWVKYAGNWNPAGREPWTYRLQRRWLLSGRMRSLVTVNGEWPGQPIHVRSFLNPCLTDTELEEGRRAAAEKTLGATVKLLFVGRLEKEKGAGHAVCMLDRLRASKVGASLDLVGDGPERGTFETLSNQLDVSHLVRFHGWRRRPELTTLLGQAHFLLLPTVASEGWPKVLSEGMAYGAVPLAGRVSCIPQYLKRYRTGRALPAADEQAYADAVKWYVERPGEWKNESQRAVAAGGLFSYSRFVEAVRALLELPVGTTTAVS
jgi:glycosyltransferase involved in cell wall biosynthesis